VLYARLLPTAVHQIKSRRHCVISSSYHRVQCAALCRREEKGWDEWYMDTYVAYDDGIRIMTSKLSFAVIVFSSSSSLAWLDFCCCCCCFPVAVVSFRFASCPRPTAFFLLPVGSSSSSSGGGGGGGGEEKQQLLLLPSATFLLLRIRYTTINNQSRSSSAAAVAAISNCVMLN